MCSTVGARTRIAGHHALAIFASDLCNLLLSHLWRHIVSRHRLPIPLHRRSISRIRIIALVVTSGTIALLNWISALHVGLLRHCPWRHYGDLCPAGKMGTTLTLQYCFETVLNRSTSTSSMARRYTHAERESLRISLSKVRGSRYLDILRIENILYSVHLLYACVVDRDPDRLLVSLKDSSLKFDSLSLNVFVSLNIDLTDNRLSLSECCFIESYPDLALRRYEMIKQTHRSPRYHFDSVRAYQASVTEVPLRRAIL